MSRAIRRWCSNSSQSRPPPCGSSSDRGDAQLRELRAQTSGVHLEHGLGLGKSSERVDPERPATTWQWSPGGRPISVRVYGTLASVDLKGDRFLRTTLGLKSTLVRTLPF